MILQALIAQHSLSFVRQIIDDADGVALCTLSNPEGRIAIEYSEDDASCELHYTVSMEDMIQDIGFSISEVKGSGPPPTVDYNDQDDPNEEEQDRLEYATSLQICQKVEKAFGKKFIVDILRYIIVIQQNMIEEWLDRPND